MNREHIQDQQVIERYLSGQLSADEEQAFEEYFMTDPEVLEQLQVAERLRQGLQALSDAGELTRNRGPAGWPRVFTSPVYAAAASVVAVVALAFSGMTYRENLSLSGGPQLADNPVATRLIPLITVRSGSDADVTVTDDDQWTVLLVDAGFTPYDDYRATVTRTGGGAAEQIWQLSGLMPTYDERIAVGLPGRLLIPGDYEILLEGSIGNSRGFVLFEEISRTRVTISPEQP
ncbi:MAG TPA: hypothetical protein VKQ06_04355 [Gammaproteobacteria bacterium]|nr:hypothetical protein [Gammaproteobacteria bacterium]